MVLNETLLETGSTRRSGAWKYGLTAATVALVLSAAYVGYAVGKSSQNQDVDSDAIMAKLVYQQTGNASELAVVSYSSSCYAYTGATCLASGCDEKRKSKCVDGKCVCQGACSGADGVCTSSPYQHVATKFTLTNGYWSSYWLYIQSFSVLSQLKVSNAFSWTFGGGQYFDLYELPGRVKGKKQYFLASNTWNNWVACIRSTGSVLTGSVSLFGLYAVNLVHTIAPWDISGVVVQVCSLEQNGEPNHIMIGSPGQHRTEWAYVHHGSWLVFGWDLSGDPGAGGHWKSSVKIPGLEAC